LKPAGVTGRVRWGTGPGSKICTLTKPVPSTRGYGFWRVFSTGFQICNIKIITTKNMLQTKKTLLKHGQTTCFRARILPVLDSFTSASFASHPLTVVSVCAGGGRRWSSWAVVTRRSALLSLVVTWLAALASSSSVVVFTLKYYQWPKTRQTTCFRHHHRVSGWPFVTWA